MESDGKTEIVVGLRTFRRAVTFRWHGRKATESIGEMSRGGQLG